MTVEPNIPAAKALELTGLISHTEKGIASRVIARSGEGSVTLFAFDVGQELNEHTAPYDALVVVLEGTLMLNIRGIPVRAAQGTVVRIPANEPHAVESHGRAKMLLVMFRERNT
ncbi:MAG TPA: cupin domain-containing protein [Thermoplasmata archaeon]|nr:cupin domain-containing protein [Thermoplasmata archaeon]